MTYGDSHVTIPAGLAEEEVQTPSCESAQAGGEDEQPHAVGSHLHPSTKGEQLV